MCVDVCVCVCVCVVWCIQVLAESHMSIHTWPEHHFAALDIFVCGVNGTICLLTVCLLVLLIDCAVYWP